MTEVEEFNAQKLEFEAQMKSKYEDLNRREKDLLDKMKRETENLTEWTKRLGNLEKGSFCRYTT